MRIGGPRSRIHTGTLGTLPLVVKQACSVTARGNVRVSSRLKNLPRVLTPAPRAGQIRLLRTERASFALLPRAALAPFFHGCLVDNFCIHRDEPRVIGDNAREGERERGRGEGEEECETSSAVAAAATFHHSICLSLLDRIYVCEMGSLQKLWNMSRLS